MSIRKKEIVRIFFDSETFNLYDNLSNKKELPFIVPYLIGACTDEPGSYQYWFGLDATKDFLEWLFHISYGKKAVLYAYNIDYDFQAIKPYIVDYFPHIKITYNLTSNKKFVFGALHSKNINIQIKDLFNWDKAYSLSRYYDHIRKTAKTVKEYADELQKYQITELVKLQIDYYKKNLHEKDGKYFYWDSENKLKELDLEQELEYLKNDVIGLPLVLFHIKTMRKDLIQLLEIEDIRDKKRSHATSLPGFGKRLLGNYLSKMYDEIGDSNEIVNNRFKPTITQSDYMEQEIAYFGGFVANNKNIYKVLNSKNPDGTGNILSIDVNSMYPWVMSEGIPCGQVSILKPDGEENKDYIVWHTIYFSKKVSPKELYRYKKKYDVFNNKFFGDSYFSYLEEAGENTRRVYILDSVLKLFKRACDGHIVIEQTLYQQLDHSLNPFIDKLYTLKATTKCENQKNSVKLTMNSLYGKLAERYHEDYYEWNSTDKNFRNICDLRLDRDSILAGLYITSKSRVLLISTILDEIDNGNTFLGCDTDSIKFIVKNETKAKLDDNKLGYWKIEGWYTDFVHNGKKKKYYLYDSTGTYEPKMATSGVKKSIIKKLSHEDRITLYSKENDVLFPKIKNASRRNKYWQIVIKSIDVRFNYEKGKPITHIYKNGKIIPYEQSN